MGQDDTAILMLGAFMFWAIAMAWLMNRKK
jgi:hypothetical protein